MTTVQTTILPDSALDDAFVVLSHERRRTVLRCLRSADRPVALADLARDVVARERETDARDVPEEAVEQCYVRLYHVHLPKLAEAGYLRYDVDRATVASTTEADSLTPLLEWAAERTG